MARFEYKVVPAPTKGTKAPGVKAGEARFANTIETLLNTQAEDGWEYLRTDILPSDERQGLTGSQTVYRTLMVFRRAHADDSAADEVIAVAQGVAEAMEREDGRKDGRKEPVVTPARADPAPAPTPDETPETPETPDPETPGPETPGPETPKKD